ncbi:MAG: chemotaxis protein CheW [Aliihoeflea sp.]|jgi:purine-binding chemotaxis protein CheW
MLNAAATEGRAKMIDIIAFQLGDQAFCVRTMAVREIRGWAPCTPLPHAPADILGVMNLRGSIIPIVDLAARLRMKSRVATERSAIVVTEIGDAVIGLLVERVSDMLTVSTDDIRPVPQMGSGVDTRFAEGIVSIESGMICFLDLEAILGQDDMQHFEAA